jgi:hypothetical protein
MKKLIQQIIKLERPGVMEDEVIIQWVDENGDVVQVDDFGDPGDAGCE